MASEVVLLFSLLWSCGATAADRSRRKNIKYKELAEALDYLFTNFAVETYGRMSDAARKVIKHLGDMYEQLHGGQRQPP